MNLVQVFGPPEDLRGLLSLGDAHFVRGSMEQRGPDRWELDGYASDAALADVRSRGLEVVVVETGEDRLARLEESRRLAQAEADALEGGGPPA